MIENFENLSLAASVASNALTVALKTSAGTDPSSSSPVSIAFRNATLTDGSSVIRCITSALSVVLSAGSTLGFSSSETGRVYVWGIDNAGTVELALSRTADIFPESNLVSTTAEGGSGGADSATTMYSTTARSNVACRCIGYIEIQTGTTAGNWSNAPSKIQVMGPGVYRTGNIVQVKTGTYATEISLGTTTWTDTGLSVSITPTSAIDKVLVVANNAGVERDGAVTGCNLRLMRDTTVLALFGSALAYGGGGDINQHIVGSPTIHYLDSPATTIAVTYKTQFQNNVGSGTVYVQFSNTVASIVVAEIFS